MHFFERIRQQYELITADPMMVDPTDFNFRNKKHNREKYFSFVKREKTLVHSFSPEVNLYKFSEHFVLLDDAAQQILYFVQFKIKTVFGHKFVVQIKLWGNPVALEKYKIEGQSLGYYVFFEHLIKLASGIGIATDSMQTPDGRRFWERCIYRAFNSKCHVYLVNQNTKNRQEVVDYPDFEEQATKLGTWNDEMSDMGNRVIISPKNCGEKSWKTMDMNSII